MNLDFFTKPLVEAYPECAKIIKGEEDRQRNTISMIASESVVSKAVMDACGSVLTNKYAEGYPGARYYSGCEFVDEAETLAIEECKSLFGVAYANVQPLSGSAANLAVYNAFLNIGDNVLSMSLDAGGHLTHGFKVSFTSKAYKFCHYGLNDEGEIDYDNMRKIAHEVKPKMIVAGCSAYSGVVDWSFFRQVCDEVGAFLFCDIAHYAGLIAAKQYPSPANIADVCSFTTHKTLMGPRGACIVSKNLDFEKKIKASVFPGLQGGPQMNNILAKAIAFKFAKTNEFVENAKNIISNAKTIADILSKEYGYIVYGKEVASHMVLINVHNKNLTGKDAADALEKIGIICNKNMVQNDVNALKCSGIRIGTVSTTTRGISAQNHIKIGHIIGSALDCLANGAFDSKLDAFKQDLNAIIKSAVF